MRSVFIVCVLAIFAVGNVAGFAIGMGTRVYSDDKCETEIGVKSIYQGFDNCELPYNDTATCQRALDCWTENENSEEWVKCIGADSAKRMTYEMISVNTTEFRRYPAASCDGTADMKFDLKMNDCYQFYIHTTPCAGMYVYNKFVLSAASSVSGFSLAAFAVFLSVMLM